MLRARTVLSFLVALGTLEIAAAAHADAPPPSQVLASDREPPRARLGLNADGAAIVLGDYAARLDVSLLPAFSVGITVGASHRRSTDDALLELGVTAWFLGIGLEGPHLTLVAGMAWAGPWTQAPELVGRLGGEAGWQFLWESLSIDLAAGAHASLSESTGAVPEARARVALGVVF